MTTALSVSTGMLSLDQDLEAFQNFLGKADELQHSLENAKTPEELLALVGTGPFRVILGFSDDEAYAKVLGLANAQARPLLEETKNVVRAKFGKLAVHNWGERINKLLEEKQDTSREQQAILRWMNIPATIGSFPFLQPRIGEGVIPAARIFIFGRQGTRIADFTANWPEILTVASGLIESIGEQRGRFGKLLKECHQVFTDDEIKEMEKGLTEIEKSTRELREWIGQAKK